MNERKFLRNITPKAKSLSQLAYDHRNVPWEWNGFLRNGTTPEYSGQSVHRLLHKRFIDPDILKFRRLHIIGNNVNPFFYASPPPYVQNIIEIIPYYPEDTLETLIKQGYLKQNIELAMKLV
jgi:hypothetical protein